MSTAGERVMAGLRDALDMAELLDEMTFPKGSRIRGEREGTLVILPSGRRFRLIPVKDD